jgi:hypothetical protein
MPLFPEAVALVEAASALLPDLPVIGWDVVLTETGPVALEANCSLSWGLIHLWHTATKTPSPLIPLVEAWLERAEGRAGELLQVNAPE